MMARFSTHHLALTLLLLGVFPLLLAYQPSSDVERREFVRRIFGTTAFTVTVGPPRVVHSVPWPFVEYKGDKSDTSSDNSDSEDESKVKRGSAKNEDTSDNESSDSDDEATKKK